MYLSIHKFTKNNCWYIKFIDHLDRSNKLYYNLWKNDTRKDLIL